MDLNKRKIIRPISNMSVVSQVSNKSKMQLSSNIVVNNNYIKPKDEEIIINNDFIKELNSYIKEYLAYYNYVPAFQKLKEEDIHSITEKNNFKLNISLYSEYKQKLLSYFNNDKEDDYFNLLSQIKEELFYYNDYINNHNDIIIKSKIYFSLFYIHPHLLETKINKKINPEKLLNRTRLKIKSLKEYFKGMSSNSPEFENIIKVIYVNFNLDFESIQKQIIEIMPSSIIKKFEADIIDYINNVFDIICNKNFNSLLIKIFEYYLIFGDNNEELVNNNKIIFNKIKEKIEHKLNEIKQKENLLSEKTSDYNIISEKYNILKSKYIELVNNNLQLKDDFKLKKLQSKSNYINRKEDLCTKNLELLQKIKLIVNNFGNNDIINDIKLSK